MATGGRTPRIVDANAAARDAGIGKGQLVSASLALAPDLVLRDRDPEAETAALAAVATWATQFTPAVALAPPDAVLVEIGGSLRLFDGLPKLTARLRRGVRDLGYAARLALAPTPTAALLFARAESGSRATGAERAATRVAAGGSPRIRLWFSRRAGAAAARARRRRSRRRRDAQSRRRHHLRAGVRAAARCAGAARRRRLRRPPRPRARHQSRSATTVRSAAALHGKDRAAGAGRQRRGARVRGEPARRRVRGMADGPRPRRPRDGAGARRTSATSVLQPAYPPPTSASRSPRRRASTRISSRCCASDSHASRCRRRSSRSRSRASRPCRSPAATSDCFPATTRPRPCRSSIDCVRASARTR